VERLGVSVKKAFVLAAGLGTRLRPVSERVPKPAWPFFGAPLCAHVLHALAEAGVEEAIVNLHHLPELLKKELTPWIPATLKVTWSYEETILGTGGALKPWLDELGGDGSAPFFLINADTYRELDLGAMAHQHMQERPTATLLLSALPPHEEGPIGVDGSGRIVRFLNATLPGAEGATGCDFAGVHLLEPELLRAVGEVDEENFCINAVVHSALVARGEVYRGHLIDQGAFWSDLGTPERYLTAHCTLLERGGLPSLARGRLVTETESTPEGGTILPPSYVEEGARVETGAVAGPFAVLGQGAGIMAGASFTRSAAWAGARVAGQINNSIFTDRGEILTPKSDK
jgi:mannose-1-phosphate guanylyltransferase